MVAISVPKERWDAVSEAERRRIEEGLRGVGALGKDDSLSPEAAASLAVASWDPIKDLCNAACDVAAGAALAWCTANTGGAATALCIAATEAARQECKRHC
ncbi:hypothetical protein [Phenylobacterium sp.]|uniref:hypothetical protein n=1 Tax=Phenylobacterium sp. TaxID=1871053 RepID=UPI003561B385